MNIQPVDTRRWNTVVLMLVQRLRRWPNIERTLHDRFLLDTPVTDHLKWWEVIYGVISLIISCDGQVILRGD